IQRHIGVAAGLAEVRESIRRAGVEDALARAERVCVRVVVLAIGADLVDRRDVPDPLAGEVLTTLAVTVCTVCPIDPGAVRRSRLIDRQRAPPRRRAR